MSSVINPQNGLLPINPLLQVYMNSVSTLSTGVDIQSQTQISKIRFDSNGNYGCN